MTYFLRSSILFALILLSLVTAATPTLAQGPGAPLQHLFIFGGVSNGGQPWAAPITDRAGNLYGATSEGGDGHCFEGSHADLGCGTVYEISPPTTGKQWTETLLYQFQNQADGTYPVGSLLFDRVGNLYGTTSLGGSANCGTVFELTPPVRGGPWIKTVLHTFLCGTDGNLPESGLAFDKLGNLYGTTIAGGPFNTSNGGNGVVFELTPPNTGGAGWNYSVLYSFQASPDGSAPQSTPIFDGSGNLYGTTISGGTGIQCALDENCGTVFKLTPPTSAGGTWTESVLYNFSTQSGDGYQPRSGLVQGAPGVFYGVTEWGGTAGRGTVYRLTAPGSSGGSWIESILYSFTGIEGSSPFGLPAVGSNGSIYGLTIYGGSFERGNVFQLAPPAMTGDPWVETSLYEFHTFAYPLSGLTFGKGGWLYGTTVGGVEAGSCVTFSTKQNIRCGEVFRILP